MFLLQPSSFIRMVQSTPKSFRLTSVMLLLLPKTKICFWSLNTSVSVSVMFRGWASSWCAALDWIRFSLRCLYDSFVFSTAFYIGKKCYYYLPNKTNASQKDKCDDLELYKNESIKYQAPKRFGESVVCQKRFFVKNSHTSPNRVVWATAMTYNMFRASAKFSCLSLWLCQ